MFDPLNDRSDPMKPLRNNRALNGSLTRLAAIQPNLPGGELVNVRDLARTADDDLGDGEMQRNASKCNMSAANVLPKSPEESSDREDRRDVEVSRERLALSARQLAAIAKLACGRTLNATAAELGIDRSTLYRWRHQEVFSKELARVTEDAVDTAATRARNLMLKATKTLSDTLNGYDRFNWALRLVNSGRLWTMGQQRPRVYTDDEATKPTDEPFEKPIAMRVAENRSADRSQVIPRP